MTSADCVACSSLIVLAARVGEQSVAERGAAVHAGGAHRLQAPRGRGQPLAQGTAAESARAEAALAGACDVK